MREKSFLNHFIIMGTGTIINVLIGIVTTPIITRIVGENVYGQYSIFTMYVSIGMMVLCMGLDQGIIRFYHEDNTAVYRRALIRACGIIPAIATIIVTIIVVVLSNNGFKFEFDTFIMLLLGVCTLAQIINRLNLVQLRAAYMTKAYSIIAVIYKIIYVALSVVFIVFWGADHFKSLIVATIIGYIVVDLIGIFVCRSDWKFWNIPKGYKFDYKGLYLYSAPYIISMGVTTLFQAIDKISLNMYCSYSEVGIYSSAMNIVHIFSIVQTTFNALWAPMAVEHYQKNPEDRSFYQKGNQIITVIMFFIGASLILFKDFFVLLLGESYREASYVIPFLIFNPIMYTISETTVGGIVFKKKSSMQIVVAIIACITNLIGNTMLVPSLGSEGAAISTGISYIVFFVSRTFISNRYYPVDWKLNKFWIITSITIVYAAYNTFFDNILVSLLGYSVLIIVMFILYKDTILEGISLGYKEIKKIFYR